MPRSAPSIATPRTLPALLLALLVPLALLLPARALAKPSAKGVVATVNGQPITRAQLDQRVQWISKRMRAKLTSARRKAIRRKVLRQLIDERLIAQQARALKVRVSEKDIDHAIKRVLKRSGLSRAELKLRLRREGKTMAVYRRLLRQMVREGKVLHRVIGRRHVPSEAELRAAHKTDPSLSRFPFARVRRVLRRQLMAKRISAARATWLHELHGKATIKVFDR